MSDTKPTDLAGLYTLRAWFVHGHDHYAPGSVLALSHEDAARALENKTAEPAPTDALPEAERVTAPAPEAPESSEPAATEATEAEAKTAEPEAPAPTTYEAPLFKGKRNK